MVENVEMLPEDKALVEGWCAHVSSIGHAHGFAATIGGLACVRSISCIGRMQSHGNSCLDNSWHDSCKCGTSGKINLSIP